MEIVPYSPAYRDAIDRMNSALSAAGSEWFFPAESRPADADERPLWMESFIAVEGDDAFGGYLLKHQRFFAHGRPLHVGDLQLPLSMGQVNGAYAHVSAALLIDVLRRSPVCYALGLGSAESQFGRLLAAAGWRHRPVPFYFNVKSPNLFARNIELPGQNRLQTILRILGHARLAGLALRLRRAFMRTKRAPATQSEAYRVRVVERFDETVDELFAEHSAAYALVGERTARVLNALYPEDDERFVRILVERGGKALGWGLLLDSAMQGHKYFGDLRVGTIADGFAAPEEAEAVVLAADEVLTGRGVDLVVSNQLHPSWCAALEQAGYQPGPSNFFFYSSVELVEALISVGGSEDGVHMNRGDGEGPGNL